VEADGGLHAPVATVEAKLRYRSEPVPAQVVEAENGFALELERPSTGIARGQIAALYDGDAVVGAGVVTGVC
jgi:tRNA U34 2-thiouridine synthase MnmA/TrmU